MLANRLETWCRIAYTLKLIFFFCIDVLIYCPRAFFTNTKIHEIIQTSDKQPQILISQVQNRIRIGLAIDFNSDIATALVTRTARNWLTSSMTPRNMYTSLLLSNHPCFVIRVYNCSQTPTDKRRKIVYMQLQYSGSRNSQ